MRGRPGAGQGTAQAPIPNLARQRCRAAAADESRFEGVSILGVDEHVWHHVSTKPVELGGRGSKFLTGMVDLSRDGQGRIRARLLDLVPGRSGEVYASWLRQRGEGFRCQVEVATLDPFHGYKNAIDDQLQDAVAVLDAFYADLLVMPTWGRRGPVTGAVASRGRHNPALG